MKYIKTFESIKNSKNAIYFIRKFLIEVRDNIGLDKNDYRFNKDNPVYYELSLSVKSDSKVDKIIKKYENIFLKQGIIMSHYKGHETDLDVDLNPTGVHFKYTIYFKDLYTNLIKPDRYVYHYSNTSNQESILNNGILPTPHSGGNWRVDSKLKYPDTIFAVNSEKERWNSGDRWKIDTTKIKNKWWEDLNFKNRKDLIMTFDPIPKEAISLDN